jgi:formimidoylglutamate deiminase
VQAIAAQVMVEMAEAGYAAVAEFHYLHHARLAAALCDLAEMAAASRRRRGDRAGPDAFAGAYEQGGCDGRALLPGGSCGSETLDRFRTS